MPFSTARQLPRANLDPIFSADIAMSVFSAQMSRPWCDETLVMLLDGQLRGSTLVTVAGTSDPTDVIEIAGMMAASASGDTGIAGLVLATVRSGRGLLAGDDERWLEAADLVDQHALLLIDWLVIGRHGMQSPREQLGMPSRWACGT